MKNIAAALIFFTRLPLSRIKAFRLPAEYFREVINYWAVVGWLTGGVMAGILWLSAQFFPYPVAIIFTLLSRLLITGALHEDGLADFLDGFGGGINKERILAIMKDSHIGTYGVVGLIFYFLLLYLLLSSLPISIACVVILIADPLCKLISSQMTRFLPYARTEEASKSKIVYKKMSVKALITSCFFGLFPLSLMPDARYFIAILFPIITFGWMVHFIKKEIGGYTGDCCGALFLLCELSFYICFVLLFNLLSV